MLCLGAKDVWVSNPFYSVSAVWYANINVKSYLQMKLYCIVCARDADVPEVRLSGETAPQDAIYEKQKSTVLSVDAVLP